MTRPLIVSVLIAVVLAAAAHAAPPKPPVTLQTLDTESHAHYGIGYHPLIDRLIVSAYTPGGTPHNFEFISKDGTHGRYANISGVTGNLVIEIVRESLAGHDGLSRGGFAPGEMFFAQPAPGGPGWLGVQTGAIARVSADGSSVQFGWASLLVPAGMQGSNGAITGLHVDTTGAFGGDLIVVTALGNVWRINSGGVATRLANPAPAAQLRGAVVVPEDPDRYGPWAGKILTCACGSTPQMVTISANGAVEWFPFSLAPIDIELIPAHQNFFGVDATDRSEKLVAAPAAEFASMAGDLLFATNGSKNAALHRVSWNGTSFVTTELATAGQWRQVTFAPVGVGSFPGVTPNFDAIAAVRHAPILNSGRVEGNLWQMLGEPLVLNGTDTVTGDLLVPGTPEVEAKEAPFFGGVIQGTGNASPSGWPISIGGRATLRHLITRTNPVELPAVAPPPAAAGTKDVPNDLALSQITNWSFVRNVRLSGNDGAVTVPAGTYGRFLATGRTAFVLGVAGATTPAVYNLQELELTGGSELRVVGPVVLNVRENVVLAGGTAGAADNARNLALRISDGGLTLTGRSVLYAVVRAPRGHVIVEGTSRLRGTVSCDRLTVSGDGVIEVVENDLAPPPVNRPPVVDAGPDRSITLPENSVELAGSATDDGLPGSALTVSWSLVEGPAQVTFTAPTSALTKATFTAPGTYVLRLTASDSLLTGSDDVVVTVFPRNEAPVVDAGPDLHVSLPNKGMLFGNATDDGLPLGKTLTVVWTAQGPASVSFADPNAASTVATFSTAGTYVLTLTANDGELSAADSTTVIVHPVNQPPQVDAGPDQMLTPPSNTIRIGGSATDDGLPLGVALNVRWSQVSGPVDAIFNDVASAVTTATFTAQGTYLLRLTASDSQFTVFDEMEVTVGCGNTSNKLDVVLVIDRSGSMAGQRFLDAKNAAKQFVDNLEPTADQVAVVSFESFAILHQTLTFNGAQAKAAIDAIPLGGGTNIAVGITTAQAELTSVRHRADAVPIMIVLSDGESNAGQADAAADAAKAAGTRIISIAISSGAPIAMREIATSLNDFFVTPSSDDLDWIYAVIAGSICRNRAPLVRAGSDFEVTLPNTGSLLGEVHDDGLPANGRITSTWSVVSGPAGVTFHDVSMPLTSATFTEPGQYELKLTANDSLATASDTVIVTVQPEPPLENASLTLAASGTGRYVINTTATLTAVLRNSSGAPIPAFPINFIVTGSNPTTAAVFTDTNGVANFVLRGTVTGFDTVLARAEGRTFTASSPAVSLEWTTESAPGTPPPVPGTTQGWIGGPLHLSTVSGQVPITIGSGITISEGRVEYWPVSNPSQITVLTTTVAGGPGTTVATFDTTVLANGSYIIRLRGKNAAGGSLKRTLSSQQIETLDVTTASELVSDVLVVVVGENKPGRVGVMSTEFSVPVSGVPITIGRRYDSLDRLRSGDFGHGWSLSIGSPRLEVNSANGVTLTDPGTGRRVSFAFSARSMGLLFFSFFLYPSFTPEPGENGKLTSDGCQVLMQVAGQINCALSFLPFKPTVYQYTDREGRSYLVTADGILREATDLSGNKFTFAANGITSSSGITIPFIRDPQGRITQITDAANRVYRYGYDAAGDLVSVTLPGLPIPIRYAYDAGHRYLTSTDARGRLAITSTYYPDGRLETSTDGEGNLTRFAYDLATNTTVTTNPDGGVVRERFNSFGLPVSVIDGLGHETKYEYDADLNLLKEENALGQITRHTYDEVGNRTSTEHGGRITRTTYNAFSAPVTLRDELGQVRTIIYDANGNATAIADNLGPVRLATIDRHGNPLTTTDASGATWLHSYDSFGRLIVRTDPLGNSVTIGYENNMGRPRTITNERGNTRVLTYDPLGRMIQLQDEAGQTTIIEYDANGNVVSETNPKPQKTTAEYDGNNRRSKVTFHDARTRKWTYDFRGNVLTETDELERVTTHTYDKAGRLVKTRYHDTTERTYGYDDIDRLTSVTDERGKTTRYEYDPTCACRERVTKIIDPLSHSIINTYDAAGRLETTTDPSTRLTRYHYDARDNLLRIEFPDTTSVKRTFDGMGRVLTEEDGEGKITTFRYDGVGNLVYQRNHLGEETLFTYDPSNNLLTVTDARLGITRYEYDPIHRVTSRRLPSSTSVRETFTYDGANNRLTTRHFSGRTTSFDYDARNRLTGIRPDPILAEPAVTFGYTPTGKRSSMTDAGGATAYTYDDRDRVLTKQTPRGTLTYTYDPAGNVLTLRSSNAGGVSLDYEYDADGSLLSVTDNRITPGKTSYAYDPGHNVTSATAPNGVVTSYTVDPVDRITDLTVKRGSTTLAGYTYTYDPAGLRLSAAEANGRRAAYTYDDADRLLQEDITGGAVNGTIAYVLDKAGNRLSRSSTVAGVTATTNTFDGNDRLSGALFDSNGNTTQLDGKTYAYDFADRVRNVNGGAATYVYDGDGNGVSRTSGGATTHYLIDDMNPTRVPQVVDELVSGAVQRSYTWGHRLLTQRQLGSQTTTRFYGHDAHGSTRLLTDATGTVTDRYDYDAFGVLLTSTGTTPNDYLFSGEAFDAQLGAYYNRARVYAQQRGRFLTRDPFSGWLDEPRTHHDYLYVGGDPVNFIDPTGETETFEKVWLRTRIFLRMRVPCISLKILNFADKAIVIGEGVTRLTGIASAIGGQAINVPNTAWSWPRNRYTLFESIRKGYWIIDAGLEPGRATPSTVYPKETRILDRVRRAGHPFKYVQCY